MEDEQIKCPKCGSTQLSANKKGWTMTTGLIGSSNVLITCLKCGKQFKPGKDLDAVNAQTIKAREMRAKLEKSPLYWLFVIGFIIFIFWAFRSCI